jgi:4-hydroxybenzoate polyprenyltransferase
MVPALLLSGFYPVVFREIWRDLRPGRILHYFVLFLFGFVLQAATWTQLLETAPLVWLKLLLFFLILAYAAVFAIATNNREDLEIDKISNPDRPLVRNTVDPKFYVRIAGISLLISFTIALLTDPVFFLAIFGISLIYYVYSCRPFKLKRYVLLAKFLIGVNSLIAAVCGFILSGGELSEFPLFWMLFILVPVSLMANFVDLKDTEGDKAAGIKTLPVLWGEPRAKTFIAVFTVIAYGLVLGYFASAWISLLLVVVCSVHLYLLFRTPYREQPLFLLHNSLFVGLIILVLTGPFLQP